MVAPVVTWLGQASFLIDAGGVRILVDPFFSELPGRAYPPLDLDEFGAGCHWVFVTHEHIDHFDPASLREIAARTDGLRIVVPEPIAAMAAEAAPGAEVIEVRPGARLEIPGAGAASVVTAVHAVHPRDGYSDGSRDGGPPRFVGYVLEVDGVALYHAGDTLAAEPVLAALQGKHVDIALLPINGRTFFRERQDLAGNMDFRDAVELSVRIGASILVPIHWDLFEANGERPGRAVDEAAASGAALHVLTLRRGLPWVAAVPPGRRPAAP